MCLWQKMETSVVINSKILKNREKRRNDLPSYVDPLKYDADCNQFCDTSIIMVKPCENTYIPPNSSDVPDDIQNIPNAFGDSLVQTNNIPKAVVAKIYEGTSISHSSPTIVRHKKRMRPKSAIEKHSSADNPDRLLGLCCTLSERSLSPTKIAIMPTLTKSATTRPLGIPQMDHSLDTSQNHNEIMVISEEKSNARQTNAIQVTKYKNTALNGTNKTNCIPKRLLSRRSADNLVLEPQSPLIHSSPESTRSVPTDKAPYRSTSHDTLTHESVSMDSLAKQSLLAAQVLHLIPTTKARERNFLQGRVAVNSLLGPAELERVLPGREVRLFVGTWNMNGQTPPKEMNDFILPSAVSHVPDILVIGTQESCSERFEWEVSLQETIGPTHVMLHAASLGTLHLAIFMRRDLIWFCSLPEDTSMSVRTGSAFRTKGAVAVSFSLFGTTYLFVTAHLTAHQEKVKERVQDIKKIIRSLDLPKNLPIRHKNKDVTQNFDCVFWCGDLNFRLGEPRDKVLQWINDTTFPLPSHMPHGYMHSDQLTAVLSDGAAFKGFQEAQIRFPPTYKYDPGTQIFDTSSKQRAPAYTDRILFKCRQQQGALNYLRRNSATPPNHLEHPFLECLSYDSVPSMVTSDHKPVWALFRNIIRPGIDTIPLAAGLFNREVYLEGVKRRAASLERSRDVSGVCSVQ